MPFLSGELCRRYCSLEPETATVGQFDPDLRLQAKILRYLMRVTLAHRQSMLSSNHRRNPRGATIRYGRAPGFDTGGFVSARANNAPTGRERWRGEDQMAALKEDDGVRVGRRARMVFGRMSPVILCAALARSCVHRDGVREGLNKGAASRYPALKLRQPVTVWHWQCRYWCEIFGVRNCW